MKLIIVSVVAIAALVPVAKATPFEGCEPCANATSEFLETLALTEKYLCCDTNCLSEDPPIGCDADELGQLCRLCHNYEEVPAYDDEPMSSSTPTTASTVPSDMGTPAPSASQHSPSSSFSSTPASPAPVAPTTSDSISSISPVASNPNNLPSSSPSVPVSPNPVAPTSSNDVITTTEESVQCFYCNEDKLSEAQRQNLIDMRQEVICNVFCLSQSLEGCGPFEMGRQCQLVDVSDGDSFVTSGQQSSSVEGNGSTNFGTSAPTLGSSSSSASDESGSCTAEEEGRCQDLSPAQQYALTSYSNGGKQIVCDPTCVGGDTLHCNYFELGQKCRGCGDCDTCTPCP